MKLYKTSIFGFVCRAAFNILTAHTNLVLCTLHIKIRKMVAENQLYGLPDNSDFIIFFNVLNDLQGIEELWN